MGSQRIRPDWAANTLSSNAQNLHRVLCSCFHMDLQYFLGRRFMVPMKIKVAFPINSSNLYCILWIRWYILGNKANKLYGICVCIQYNLVEIHQLSFYSQLLTLQRKDYFKLVLLELTGLSRWLSGKESTFQCRKCGFDTWVGKIPWRRKWQSTPTFLPGKQHGQRSMVVYSLWDPKELEMTHRLDNKNVRAGKFKFIREEETASSRAMTGAIKVHH